MTQTTELTDLLDDVAHAFLDYANTAWAEGRARRIAGDISRQEYDEIKAGCRALIRRSVEVVTSASILRLREVQGSIEQLAQVTENLKVAKKRLDKAKKVTEAVIVGVAAVSFVVAAVAAPSPATIGGAVAATVDLIAATAAAADDAGGGG